MCEQNKNSKKIHVFVRKNRVGPLETQKLFFYVKKPVLQIRGTADFVERLAGDYTELWNKYGEEACLRTFDEYVTFLQGRRTATFIRFTNFCEFENPISIEVINKVLRVSRIPRGGKYLNRETANQFSV